MMFNIEPETDELEPYRIRLRQEIITLLRSLAVRQQLLHMNFDGGEESLVTAILKVHEPDGSLIVSGAPGVLGYQRIAESREITFETVLDRVRIVFSVKRAEICEYQSRPALRMEIPASLIRLQRRESFRVPIPVTEPVRCTIRLQNDNGPDSAQITLALQNVSGGGIALIDETMALDDTVGRIYEQCRIDLPGASPIVTNLQIRNSRNVRLANGKTVRRLGCLFLDLPRPMMAAVQRYILNLEREQNARMSGLG
ncbi:MAG: flagellar regulator YcgR PilZN domain-containing protein [Pseudomonadota bacterium]